MAGKAQSFQELGVPDHLVTALNAAGWRRPSPVQQASIPLGMAGSDLIVQAKSGTGKTVAFSTMLLERVSVASPQPQVGHTAWVSHALLPSCPPWPCFLRA